jgi:hypothetical protein
MAILVTIDKKPLYGSVYWDGNRFVYTPNPGFSGNDFYVYTLTDGTSSITKTNYVSTDNLAPSASDIQLTIDANVTTSIDVKDYISDVDGLIEKLRVNRLSKTSFGNATFNGTIITYKPLGFSGYDIFNYTITDGQYESIGEITLNVINGRTYEPPPEVLAALSNTQTIANDFASLSSSWNAATTLVATKSSKWINIDKDKYEDISTIVQNNSADWNASANNLENYDAAYNVVTSSSANWDGYITILDNLTSSYESNSAYWYDAYNTVQSLSGGWQNNVTEIYNLTNSYSSNSGFWNASYLLVNSQSSYWDKSLLTNIVSSNSANWTSGYTTITANSATWTYAGIQLINTYNAFSALSTGWEDTSNIVKANSSTWNQSSLITIFSNNSAKWNTIGNLVTAQSSNWDSAYTASTSISTLLSANSADWTNAYNTVCSESANWGGVRVLDFLDPLTANWNNTYTTLTTYSAKWNTISAVDVVYNILTGNSAFWQSSYNVVSSGSANWNDSYTNVNSNSSIWLSGATNVNALFNNLTAIGNVVIYGNISAAGSITQQTSENTTASSFSIINTGFADAFSVKKTIANGALADFNVNNQSVLYVNTNNRIGINTKNPGQALTVVGDISASGSVYATIPAEYTVFSNNSSTYDRAFTYLQTTSGSIITLLDSKPTYDSAYTYLTGASAGINAFYPIQQNLYNNIFNAVTAQSAQNYSAYATVCSTSANIGTDTLFRSKSANYENAYNFITANSAGWIPNNPVFNSLRTTVLTSGPVTLTNAVLSTFTNPITASEQFLSIIVNNQTRLIQLWNA